MPLKPECPYGPNDCPKLAGINSRIYNLEKNQLKLMHVVYYIAGIVSVTLGVSVII